MIRVNFGPRAASFFADKNFMSTAQNSQSIWFKDVIQPQLDILSNYIAHDSNLQNFDAKSFFKIFLADLEMLGLDNMVVENCTERIVQGIETIKATNLDMSHDERRELAMIALIKSRFDRSLFKGYWSHYLPFVKKHKDIKDEAIVNAYKVQLHIQALVSYVVSASRSDHPPQSFAA
jgi:hypothetical protein